MWHFEKVERALFTWPVWRKSVIHAWVNPIYRLKDSRLRRIREIAGTVMSEMKFPKSVLLEMYWYCCILSDYSMNSWTTFDGIRVPRWLLSVYEPILDYDIKPGDRMFPPFIIDEGDLAVQHKKMFGTYTSKPDYRLIQGEKSDQVFLSSEHELYRFLNKFKGRTRRKVKPRGRPPKHSDRMAVISYELKLHGATYLKIAKKFKLPTEEFDTFTRSSAAMHLVQRGEKLAREAEEQVISPLPQAFEEETSG